MRARWASSFHFVLVLFGPLELLVTVATRAVLEVSPAIMKAMLSRMSNLEKHN